MVYESVDCFDSPRFYHYYECARCLKPFDNDRDSLGERITITSPVDGKALASVFETTPEAYERVLTKDYEQTSG